ncbi:chemotaxis protein CheB [Aquabacterium sp.]|uniref:chemotaxis protein CheB n=1 Tax=Aquabacterium sp. TaxID=1872578 RepID=UPI002C4F1843|nr:chemotaxis protein CheB [Aquabacterium sp.]HSW04038.1 chemotaxis protein CheB [Aquabacterium sp.]
MSSSDTQALPPVARMAPRIVGLGASAGGLEPLLQFLAQVPAHSGLAYIVVQHMDPTRKALLAELLQRATVLPVREVTESMSIEPDMVYVIPPNSELTVARAVLHLADPAQRRGMRLPIDVLFGSLARDQGDRAIGVVLSGMGTDGTVGLQAIKSQGGLTLAQQPDSAQFDSMPRSAIAAGCVDVVGLAGDLPAHILRVAAPEPPAGLPAAERTEAANEQALDLILGLLREHNKHDLSLYKTSTLQRRIERRVSVHGLDTMAAYARFLRQNPQELALLFKEMLIGVTSFFRDAAVWQELQELVLPEVITRRLAEDGHLRAWIAGCSTGEEAYSLAMAFREAVDGLAEGGRCTLQVFASDLNADAIAAARSGHYPASIAQAVSPERLARFFSAKGGGFVVNPEIRSLVLFAQHDVILDPPFTRIDILCCRNLLIYFNAALQRRLVPLFHYSLRPGGALLLGASETVGRSQSLFAPVQPKSRWFWRSDTGKPGLAAGGSLAFPVSSRDVFRTGPQESSMSLTTPPPANLQALADQVLLESYSPPVVLVNDRGDVLYIRGRTAAYLEPASGKANWNIHVMARPGIRMQLAGALRTALQEGRLVELHGLRPDDEAQHTVDVTVQPIHLPKALANTVMIVFRELSGPAAGRTARRRRIASAATAMDEELARSQEEIRLLRQEMQASQEQLQAANEELQATNEELQSANEELTTSKEEAQSMNEELQSINSEMQSKLDDLALAQSDMQNLLNATDIATLFLDNELNVRRFTEQVGHIFHLRDIDIGRPLSDLASTLTYPQLHADAKETLRTLAFCEKQIPTSDGRWYAVRIMPYRTLADVIQGVVITFVDITAAKELESRLRKA